MSVSLATATHRLGLPGLTLSSIWLAWLVMSFSVAASADPPPSSREQAIAHSDQADAYFRAGAFAEAADEYAKAYALEARPGLLFNIALAHEKNAALEAAIAAYERYLDADPDGVKVTEARARRAALIGKQRRAKEKPESADESPAGSASITGEPSRPSVERRSMVAPLVTSGVAAALVGGGVFFGLRARSLEDELRTELESGASTLRSDDARFDRGRRAVLTANVLFVGSAVVAGAAGFLWWRALAGTRRETYVTPTGNGVAFGGTF